MSRPHLPYHPLTRTGRVLWCMALAAFGFAQYDSKRLVVREGDKVVRKLCATFDAMSDDVLKTTLHATARVTYSPTGASVTVR